MDHFIEQNLGEHVSVKVPEILERQNFTVHSPVIVRFGKHVTITMKMR